LHSDIGKMLDVLYITGLRPYYNIEIMGINLGWWPLRRRDWQHWPWEIVFYPRR
jgi:hypothetical protein